METAEDISDYKVTSEVHVFSEGVSNTGEEFEVTSLFKFTLPDPLKNIPESNFEGDVKTDEDGDLVVKRRNHNRDHNLVIKHQINTSLDLVGLQVWRGALLLGDFLLHSCLDYPNSNFKITMDDSVVELGAGTGLTSVVAGMVAGQVLSTDISSCNILKLIEANCQENSKWIRGKVSVCELDFYKDTFSEDLTVIIEKSKLIIAADVVYHDDLTDAFLKTLKKIMLMGVEKTALIALEKRFVFTISDLDVVAPCYDYFFENLQRVLSAFDIEQLNTSLVPQYFCYERVKELVLFKIQKKGR